MREIQHLAAAHPVEVLCPLPGISRSGHCDWRGRAPSRMQSEDAQLTEKLKAPLNKAAASMGARGCGTG